MMTRKGVLALMTLAAMGVATVAQAPQSRPIVPVALDAVRLTGGFWRARLATNRDVTIPHILDQNEITGRVANFAKAAKRASGTYEGRRFNDTDVYKIIEAASYSLIQQPNPQLSRRLDDLIALIAAAQEPDGYLYPARTIDPARPAPGAGPSRWVQLNGSHELYNAGHLYEAAVAHFRATGKRSLLDVAVRNARLIRWTFGPDGLHAVPGHQEIELALVRLAESTGDASYADLARFFLDQRGRPHETQPYPDGPFAMYNDRAYRQDHLPVVEQGRAAGHAVRATYMYAGMADVAMLFQPPGYRTALERLFADVVSKRLYVTGGIGARSGTESFGDDYELPNREAYTETCAAVGLEQWASRMFRLTGDGKYLDLAERVLYNGLLSGVSAGGDRFFYQNPLAADSSVRRSAYFEVACCPANLARTLARLPGLMYATDDTTVYLNVFGASEARLTVAGTGVRLTQRTDYPWDGDFEIRVEPERAATFTVAIRIPGWARGKAVDSDLYRFSDPDVPAPTAIVNGNAVPVTFDRGFARISRSWRTGEVIHLHLPMPVQRVLAHDSITANRGRAAFQRGPLVYALEGVDAASSLDALRIPIDAGVRASFRTGLLGGVQVLTGTGEDTSTTPARPRPFVAIPYFAWANRGPTEMVVWVDY
jgi:hypothetical protein